MQRQIQTALLMAASLFMDMMDGTIVTSAIPSIAEAFRVSESTASLLVSSYIIAYCPCGPYPSVRLAG